MVGGGDVVVQGLAVSGLHATLFQGRFLIYRRFLVGETPQGTVSVGNMTATTNAEAGVTRVLPQVILGFN